MCGPSSVSTDPGQITETRTFLPNVHAANDAVLALGPLVDELLGALERNKNMPAPLSKAVNSVYLHVLRAFAKSPLARPTRHEIADALDKLKQGLQLARAQRGEPAAMAAAGDLERLSRLVESQYAMMSAAVERR